MLAPAGLAASRTAACLIILPHQLTNYSDARCGIPSMPRSRSHSNQQRKKAIHAYSTNCLSAATVAPGDGMRVHPGTSHQWSSTQVPYGTRQEHRRTRARSRQATSTMLRIKSERQGLAKASGGLCAVGQDTCPRTRADAQQLACVPLLVCLTLLSRGASSAFVLPHMLCRMH